MDKGLIVKPTKMLNIDCYIDADFAGLWPHDDKNDPTCVKSRSRYVICLSYCPVVWCSKLQHEITTSTLEAEYNALSIAMRELLPFKHLVETVAQIVGIETNDPTTVKTRVWECQVIYQNTEDIQHTLCRKLCRHQY
jgi:hypothetical protein